MDEKHEIKKNLRYYIRLSFYYIRAVILYWYGCYLDRKRKDPYRLTDADVPDMRRIEAEGYKDIGYLEYDECETLKDVVMVTYVSHPAQIYYIHRDDWFMLAIDRLFYVSVENLVAASGRISNPFVFARAMCDLFKGRRIRMCSRDKTSYPLLKALEKGKKIQICSDRKSDKSDEEYGDWHDVEIKIL